MQCDELIWQNINKDKKKNPKSGFVTGIIEIRANAALQKLVPLAPVISAPVLLMQMVFYTEFTDTFLSDTYLELI